MTVPVDPIAIALSVSHVLDTIGIPYTMYVHPPEDILLQKLRWYRAGGEVLRATLPYSAWPTCLHARCARPRRQ